MKRLFFFLTGIIFSLINLSAQINTDTPNLSFEIGSFQNWERYTGYYYYDPTLDVFDYGPWTKFTGTSNRFVIGSNANDPIVYCDLKNSPLNKNAARIGEPRQNEMGSSSKPGAAAEKMVYRFKVANNTTLFSYNLAAILKAPNDDKHAGDQRPNFQMDIQIKDANGDTYFLPCSSYSTKADFANPQLIRNKTKLLCPSSSVTKPDDYVYQPWMSGNIDLSAHVGDSVIVTVINHDCLYDYGGTAGIKGGTHEAYGYFWAQTRKIQLETFSCEDDDATIVAPPGFSTYQWTRSDGKPITAANPAQPNIVVVDKSLNLEGIVYTCEMNDLNSSCGAITLSTTIEPVKLYPQFSNAAIDAGKIQFTDASTSDGDNITNYYWDFGDGSFSSLKNPVHEYFDFIPYNVKLTVTSSKGCSKTISQNVLPTKELVADIFPPANLEYNGQTKDFSVVTNISGFQLNIDYYVRYTNKPGTPYYNSYTAPSNAGSYNATFELSYVNLLKYFMVVVPSKDFVITRAPLTVTVNNASKVYGQTVGLQREGFTQSRNPLFAGDKIYELNVSCSALADTVSTGTYPILADQAIGLGVDNYEIVFVPGVMTVHPKAISIRAVDQVKTYGDIISPAGTEFYIPANSLVGDDSVISADLVSAGFAQTATVGSYAINVQNAAGKRLSNYSITYQPGNIVVDKKPLTITANPLQKIYGAEYVFQGNEYQTSLSQLVGDDEITLLSFSSVAGPFKAPVGDYSLNITGISGNRLENYDIKFVGNTFKVLPMPVTVIARDAEKEYGTLFTFSGNEFTTDKALVEGDNITFVQLKSTGTQLSAPIGEYDIQASGAYGSGTLNYDFSYQTGTLKVIKKKITADIFPPANLVYNGQEKTFAAEISIPGFVLFSDYVIRYRSADGSYNSTTAPIMAGDYVAGFELTASASLNYQIDNAPSKAFTILRAAVTITANDAVKTYGDVVTLAGNAFRSDLSPLYGGDVISSVTFSSDGLAAASAVGTYPVIPVAVSGSGMSNYNFTFVNGTLTVNRKALRVQGLDLFKTYGEQYTSTGKEFYVDPNSLVATDTVSTVLLTSAGFVSTAPVGTHLVTVGNATGRGLDNYDISYANATLHISKKNITVTARALSKVYGSEYVFTGQEFETDHTAFAGTDNITSVQLSSNATALKAQVGDHNITLLNVSGSGLNNYDIKTVNAVFKVNPMPVTVIARDAEKEYGTLYTFSGNEFTTDKALVEGDNITFVQLKSTGTQPTAPIGDYDIHASGAYGSGTLNYDFSYQTGTLRVIRKKITADIFPPANLVYNGQEKTFTAQVSIPGFTLFSDYVIRYRSADGSYNSTTAPVMAGDYVASFELTGAASHNYQIDSAPSKYFTISKAAVTITANDAVKTYGDALTLAGNAFRSDLSPLYGGDVISAVTFSSDGLAAASAVGTYPVIPVAVSGSGMSNYNFTFVNGTLTVNRKALRVQGLDLFKTYGEQYTSTGKEFYVDPNSLVATDTVSTVLLTSAGFVSTAPVGTHLVTVGNATGRGLDNYDISYANATLHISKKNITVTARALSKVYGSEYVFTGQEFETDRTAFAGTDNITSVQLSSNATALKAQVGDHNITLLNVSGSGLNNYDIKTVNAVFTVKPMPVTVIAHDAEKEYGALYTFSGNEFSTDKALVKGDTILNVVLKSQGSKATAMVGDYSIEPAMAYGAGTMNYEFSYAPGNLKVVKKKLTATLLPPDYLGYDSRPKEFRAVLNVSELLPNSDYYLRYSTLSDPANYSYTAPSKAGDYRVELELNKNSLVNYSIDTLPWQNFRITKAALAVTAGNGTKTYGDQFIPSGATYTADMKPLYGSDVILSVSFDCAGFTETAPAGTYEIKAVGVSGSGLENYELSFFPGTLTVNRKAITVRGVDMSKMYGEVVLANQQNFSIDARAMVGNDSILMVLQNSEGFSSKAVVGLYPVTLSNATGRGLENYQISYSDGLLQVYKRPLTIQANIIQKVYGNEYMFKGSEFQLNYLDLVGSDKVNSVKLNSQGAKKQATVGEYVISVTDVSGFGLENYDIKLLGSVLRVTARDLVVTARNQEKGYGDAFSFTGNEFTMSESLVNNDTISFVFMYSTGSVESAPIGTHEIIPSQASGNGSLNYNITYRKGTMTVKRKALKVFVGNYTKEYGQPDPEISYTVHDERGIEYVSAIFSGKPVRTSGETPGEYNIGQGTLSASDNYDFSFSSGTLLIKKAQPFIYSSFSNDNAENLLIDMVGVKNGKTPTGMLNVEIASEGFSGTATIVNGESKCLLSNLPDNMVTVSIHYPGNENYLPATQNINIYAIRYHVNGGDLTSPIRHFDGNESIKPVTPTRTLNYIFDGWYETPDFTGEPVRRISAGTHRDVDLYAKWLLSYDDLSIVVLFNQVLAVANPLNREFIYRSTFKWTKDGVPVGDEKQFIGFDNYVPSGKYRVEIYYENNIPIVLELDHTAVIPQSLVYPNPVSKMKELNVVTEKAASESVNVQVFNAAGQQAAPVKAERQNDMFKVNGFDVPGIYFIRIVENGKVLETHKVIVED